LRAAADLEAGGLADEAGRERRQANAFYLDVGAVSGVSAVE
jgi:hypothetical protein